MTISAKNPVRFVVLMLAFAVLACIGTGTSETPEPEPVQEQEETEPAEPDPATQGESDSSAPSDQPVDTQPASPSTLTPEEIDQVTAASVQILATDAALNPQWTGSGTIINPTGEIITNCHVACGAPVLLILMTESADQAPEPRYRAEITHFDDPLDIAILQITADVDGNPISPTDLPFIEVGDSNSLRLGDPIRVFGYPGVGGSTITFTSGSVSGFESATVAGTEQRVVVKTDADIASGNSGGTAVNLEGQLVGIPTLVNPDIRDGVTIGGIGVLRPVNLVDSVRQTGAGQPSV
ncbi:MAG: trypsin-like peptidase domain-containing protein, partial [Chloroflexi bacterium]|nr:trypsin-like peptidase domain-containing protein [Chloroflexota bacterium]